MLPSNVLRHSNTETRVSMIFSCVSMAKYAVNSSTKFGFKWVHSNTLHRNFVGKI